MITGCNQQVTPQSGCYALQVLVHSSVGTGGLCIELYIHCLMNRSIIILAV